MQTTERIYQRGLDLYRNGAVAKTLIKGVFEVGPYLVDTRGTPTCSCPYHTHRPDFACKHIVATLRRMLDDLRYATAQ